MESNDKGKIKVPKFNWIPFNANNIPDNLMDDCEYLVLVHQVNYKLPDTYHVDIATPYGNYINNFWDTLNDWDEGEPCTEVIAFAELPCGLKESDLKTPPDEEIW